MSSDLGKNAGHTPGSLGGRSIVVIRQAGRQTIFLQIIKILKFSKLI